MTNQERSAALQNREMDIDALIEEEGQTIPWSAGTRRSAYLQALQAAKHSLRAAYWANSADEGETK